MSGLIAKSHRAFVSVCLSAGLGLLVLVGCDGGSGRTPSGQTGQAPPDAPAGIPSDAAMAPGVQGDKAPHPAGSAETNVSIDNFTFTPETLEIRAGTKVVWRNGDDVPHTVRSTDDLFRSEALDTDDKFEQMFSEPGTYEYYCGIHTHMTGKIIVK